MTSSGQRSLVLVDVRPDPACREHQRVGLIAIGRRVARGGGVRDDQRHFTHGDRHTVSDGNGNPQGRAGG